MLAIIVRILGNENPPRDRPGKRLAVLQTILETEPEFPDVGKHYLVNRIWDTTYQSKVLALLNHHHASYSIIPFDWTITPTHEAICRYGIGINQARNAAILWGSTRARYTVVLDGDCQFTSEGMQPLLEEMQRGNYTYLSIPFRREAAERQEEPQLAFRADAPLRFDSNLPFGANDKLELLFRLGHEQVPYSGHLQISGEQTKLVGEVLHHTTGDPAAERDNRLRQRLRRESLEELVRQIQKRKAELCSSV